MRARINAKTICWDINVFIFLLFTAVCTRNTPLWIWFCSLSDLERSTNVHVTENVREKISKKHTRDREREKDEMRIQSTELFNCEVGTWRSQTRVAVWQISGFAVFTLAAAAMVTRVMRHYYNTLRANVMILRRRYTIYEIKKISEQTRIYYMYTNNMSLCARVLYTRRGLLFEYISHGI